MRKIEWTNIQTFVTKKKKNNNSIITHTKESISL